MLKAAQLESWGAVLKFRQGIVAAVDQATRLTGRAAEPQENCGNRNAAYQCHRDYRFNHYAIRFRRIFHVSFKSLLSLTHKKRHRFSLLPGTPCK